MSVAPVLRPPVAFSWRTFEAWVGTRSSAVVLFGVALAVFAIQSVVLPVYPGRDMARYVQAFVQLGYRDPVVPSVMNTRGPLSDLGVGLPLELGGWFAEIWLATLYAASIVAWGRVSMVFGPHAAVVSSALLLVYPGYGILFHGLASDALFAAAFAGWAVLVARAILNPSSRAFLVLGLGMGLLVLVRPANQALILFTLLPLFLRVPWDRRVRWAAAFFVGSVIPTQGWKVFGDLYYGDTLGLQPSAVALATAFVFLVLLFPRLWRRRLALLAVAIVVPVLIVAAGVEGSSVHSPTYYLRSAAQSPSGDVFLYRAFELDRIMSPDNGPASREVGRAVQRELLAKEPYRSYGVDLDEFFSSGSDRIFGDLTSLSGSVDFSAATSEAIRAHPSTFAGGIGKTIWDLLARRHVYTAEPASRDERSSGASARSSFIVVNGRKLPRPSEGQPIPASRVGLAIGAVAGSAGEVWLSPTRHPLVFQSAIDERRYEKFNREAGQLNDRIPTREPNHSLVHRLNQASHAFPPPVFWLALGLVAFALRRPRRAHIALALAVAGLVVIIATGMVAPAVAEYSAPVSPAFIVLAAAGLLGIHPRRQVHLRWRLADRQR